MQYKSLSRAHPIPIFIYFFFNIILIMIQRQPMIIILQTISLIILTRNFHKSYFFILLIISLSNPLFVHKGATILCEIASIPITLESLIYGFIFGLLIINVFMLCSLMNKTLNSEHYIYLFGNYFPHIGLLISMIAQLIPRFMKQYQVIQSCQKQFYQGNIIKQLLHTFSIETSWAFESSIDMLDSMSARGYGTNKRTHYHLFQFTYKDMIFVIVEVLFFVLCLISYYTRYKNFYYYPIIIFNTLSIIDYLSMFMFMIIILLPMIGEGEYVRGL